MRKETYEQCTGWHFGMKEEEYEQLIRNVRDTKTAVLTNFNYLLDYAEEFYHLPEELEKGWSLMEGYYKSSMRIFISFCIYRLSAKLRTGGDKMAARIKDFECDCCQGVTEFYKEAYRWLNNYVCEPAQTSKGYQLRYENTIFKGDTMTSVFTPLKEYFKLKYGIEKTTSETEDWETFWLNNLWEAESGKLREADVIIQFPYYVNEFICACYCCANFLPVPQGFNTGRSNHGRWDSWDLTLHQIYQWYLDNPNPKNACAPDNRALEELFRHASNREDTIQHCTEWLTAFGSWENFVEQNYMQSFLLPDGSPKRFFKNHTLEYGLPKTLDEYEEFFENAVSCITERGNIMNKSLDTGIRLE